MTALRRVLLGLACRALGHRPEWRVVDRGAERQYWKRCSRCGRWQYEYTSWVFEE